MTIGVAPISSQLPVTDDKLRRIGMAGIPQPWANWFTQAFQILFSVSESGTTALRPTKNLWVGRTYFDATINRPIWWTGTNWINAAGTVV